MCACSICSCLIKVDVQGHEYMLKIQGTVFSAPAQRKKTGRAVTVPPANATDENTIKPLLKLSLFVRMRGKVRLSWRRRR